MDPEVFPDPKVFNPQRFLDENGNLKTIDQFAPSSIGRRICMGITLAKNTRDSHTVRATSIFSCNTILIEIPIYFDLSSFFLDLTFP